MSVMLLPAAQARANVELEAEVNLEQLHDCFATSCCTLARDNICL